MQKNTFVTEAGIDIEYDFLVHKHTISWAFEEITDIHKEQVKDKATVVLYFLKGVMSRRLAFYRTDIEILAMAKDRNPNIHIEDVD